MKEIVSRFNQWLRGDSTDEQRYQLERDSLDDEMLYDAMEGIELHHKSSRSTIESRLHQRLQQHKSQRKAPIIRMWPYAAAASLALIMGIYGVLRLQNDTPVTDTLALEAPEDTAPQMAYSADQVASDELSEASSDSDGVTSPPEGNSAKQEVSRSVKTSTKAQEAETMLIAKADEPNADKMESAITKEEAAIALVVQDEVKNSDQDGQLAAVEYLTESDYADDTTGTIAINEGIAAVDLTKAITTKKQANAPMMSMTADSDAAVMMRKGEVKSSDNSIWPQIGEEAMMKILKEHPFDQSQLFMKGIKLGKKERISFDLDSNGRPINVDAGRVPAEDLNKLLKLVGPWPSHSGRVYFDLPIIQ